MKKCKHNYEKLQRDQLTWLFNRHRYQKDFNTLLNWLLKEKRHFSCVVIDIDKFKLINDNYNHLVWDTVLRYLAIFLVKEFWENWIYRFWWEEFLILFHWSSNEII